MSTIEGKLGALVEFFTASRQVGHTSAALDGVRNTPGARLIVPFHTDAQRLKALGIDTVVLSGDPMRGTTFPTVIDNHAAAHIAVEALNRITELKDECEDITQSKNQQIAELSENLANWQRAANRQYDIAADLLAALKTIVGAHTAHNASTAAIIGRDMELPESILESARAAIAAAEGKEGA